MRNFFFYLIIVLYLSDFFWDQFLSYLNRTQMSPNLPKELEGIYDSTEYARQQAYQKENSRFAMISDGVSLVLVMTILLYGGVGWLDELLRRHIDNAVVLSVAFFWTFTICSWFLDIPFSWYDTFIIEQKYGFNKTTRRTFAFDELKSVALKLIIEGVIISILVVAFNYIKGYSWLWAWAAVSAFMLTISFFYSEWIVPIFNKQTPLEEGELREAIEIFARRVSFPISNIYVIDGSKRSTKSNAYFTGFGKKKRIVLYDTLINDLNKEEITAILAHEIGHYKMKHVIYQMAISISYTGLLLWALTLFLDNPEIAHALGGTTPSFHLAVVGFSLLYSPLSEIFNFGANYISRKNEYAADNFAALHGTGEALIAGLKKISSKALSNLTPHHFVVFWRYSHPTLLQRMRKIYDNASIDLHNIM